MKAGGGLTRAGALIWSNVVIYKLHKLLPGMHEYPRAIKPKGKLELLNYCTVKTERVKLSTYALLLLIQF